MELKNENIIGESFDKWYKKRKIAMKEGGKE
jgi:hypothetical protein